MKNKVYLTIYKGKETYFSSWSECSSFVKNKPNIIYKGFPTKEEADIYLKNYHNQNKDNPSYDIDVYSDGSFDPKQNIGSWAWVSIKEDQIICEDYGINPTENQSRNIDGELQAVLNSCLWAQRKSIEGFNLYFDYIGIEYWAKNQWRAKTQLSINYQDKIQAYIHMINFKKVKSHSNNQWNDYVDNLAKNAFKKSI